MRCLAPYYAIDRVEDRAVAFLVSEGRTISKKTAFLFFHSFFNTSSSSGKSLRARAREQKRVEQNQTALPVGDIYSDLRADLALTGAIGIRYLFAF